MELDQLKKQWQQRNMSVSEGTVSEGHVSDIEGKMQALDREIRSRTLYGILTFSIAIIAMIAFMYLLFLLEEPLLAIGGVLTWVVCLVAATLRLLVVQKKHFQSNDVTDLESALLSKLRKVESEIRFYETVVLWVLAPMSVGVVMILAATQASLLTNSLELGMFSLFAYWGHRFNQQHIANKLKPVEEDLKLSLQAFESA